jgi:cyclopropane-fatty-acyl-phospholipid synthase
MKISMLNKILLNKYSEFLESIDVEINGNRPWDITVHNPDLYKSILFNGSLGFGESYMKGWFDCERLDLFFEKVLKQGVSTEIQSIPLFLGRVKSKFRNLQSISRAFQVAEQHYDIGNDLFSLMLDKTMMYTCGYWTKDVNTLEESQLAKLDLVAKKLDLKPGMKVLDIGCGWGGAAKHFANNYGVNVVGITVSKEQIAYAKENSDNMDVDFRLMDYRDLNETFDAIYSIGMFEAVGYKNYREFFEIVRDCLKDNGTFLLHTIGANESTTTTDPWVEKYIFPNGMMPSAKQITEASEGIFIFDDWHNIGPHYDKTLMCWYENFVNNYEKLKIKYDNEFYRMWTFWLLSSAANFRSRTLQLWQVLFSLEGSERPIQTYK